MEVICSCSAYHYPHRYQGGRCGNEDASRNEEWKNDLIKKGILRDDNDDKIAS